MSPSDSWSSTPFDSWSFTPLPPPQDSSQASRESCTMQAIIAGLVGGGAGMVLGAVLTPFNSSIQQLETQDLPLKEQLRRGAKEVGVQSRSWGKNLMVIGAVFSCTECFVEKARGRSDRWNAIGGGCITGGVLAAGAGPQAMAFGCVGFAAFSAAIDALGFGHFD
eukprot:CAMPEP_0119377806 /NCGR_PEP_ID=MMETSP1334-20130426/46745_1 /TAXON_ID=127549 /ORGANISM="Calcidiscus leptoporus, Strain RCC1130" /LENGTH=164 /DNA_ID=CAMNT_0007396833 /DNA_START=11 /DNA_END=505 /DNA_ORIENTATION=+